MSFVLLLARQLRPARRRSRGCTAARMRQTEVDDLRLHVFATARVFGGDDEHVVRLEVAMDDPKRMGRRERACALGEDAEHLRVGARLRRCEPRAKRLSLNELHRDERRSVGGEPAGIEDGHGVRMAELRHRARLAKQSLLFDPEPFAKDLQRDGAIERRIVCMMHDPHRARAEDAKELVARLALVFSTCRGLAGLVPECTGVGGDEALAFITRVDVCARCFELLTFEATFDERRELGVVEAGRLHLLKIARIAGEPGFVATNRIRPCLSG